VPMDVEKTTEILNAIATGLFRIVEILVPVMLIFCMGILKAITSAFVGANVYRKEKGKKTLLTHLDEI
jgi:uncharacterized protein YybS (DUF2232 family)